MASRQGELRVAHIKQELKDKNYIKQQADTICALVNENGVLTRELDKFKEAQKTGYMTYIEDKEGMVIGVSNVLPYSKYTYLQDIPVEIGTVLYNIDPFYKMNNGQLEKDTQKYNKYKLLGGL